MGIVGLRSVLLSTAVVVFACNNGDVVEKQPETIKKADTRLDSLLSANRWELKRVVFSSKRERNEWIKEKEKNAGIGKLALVIEFLKTGPNISSIKYYKKCEIEHAELKLSNDTVFINPNIVSNKRCVRRGFQFWDLDTVVIEIRNNSLLFISTISDSAMFEPVNGTSE